MDLREKIEATLRQWIKPDVFVSEDNLAPVAAAILAIPEIREAISLLRECAEFLEHEGASTEAKESDALSKRCAAAAKALA